MALVFLEPLLDVLKEVLHGHTRRHRPDAAHAGDDPNRLVDSVFGVPVCDAVGLAPLDVLQLHHVQVSELRRSLKDALTPGWLKVRLPVVFRPEKPPARDVARRVVVGRLVRRCKGLSSLARLELVNRNDSVPV